MIYTVQPQLEKACWVFTFEFYDAIISAQMTKSLQFNFNNGRFMLGVGIRNLPGHPSKLRVQGLIGLL